MVARTQPGCGERGRCLAHGGLSDGECHANSAPGPGCAPRYVKRAGRCERYRGPQRTPTRGVRRIILDPYYAGSVRMFGEERPGNHEPLIPRDLFDGIRARLTRLDPVAVRVRKGGRRPSDDYLLRGVAVCARCGAGIYTRRMAAGRVYLCAGVRESRGTCDLPILRAEVIGSHVLAHLDRFGMDLTGWLTERAAERRAERAALVAEVERQREALAALQRHDDNASEKYGEALDDGDDAFATLALREMVKIDRLKKAHAAELEAAEARVAGWKAESDVKAAYVAYQRLVDLVAGRIGRADSMAALNVAMRDLVARCEVEVDEGMAELTFALAPGAVTIDGMELLTVGLGGVPVDHPTRLLPPLRLMGVKSQSKIPPPPLPGGLEEEIALEEIALESQKQPGRGPSSTSHFGAGVPIPPLRVPVVS